MKVSTQLRRERKRLRNSSKRKIAIDIETNVMLRGLTSPRGLSVHTVVLDDASFWPPGVQKVPLEPTIRVLEPRDIPHVHFSDYIGAEVILSTPPPLILHEPRAEDMQLVVLKGRAGTRSDCVITDFSKDQS